MNVTTVRTVLGWLDQNTERYLLVLTYTYIVFIVIVGVFNRFVLQAIAGWGWETAKLMFIWLVWLGASLAVRQRSHIRIDFLYRHVSDRTQGLLYVFSNLSIIAFCALSIDAFVPVMETTSTRGATLVSIDLTKNFFKLAVPVGLGLMVVRAVQMTVLDIKHIRAGEEPYEGEPLFDIYKGEDR